MTWSAHYGAHNCNVQPILQMARFMEIEGSAFFFGDPPTAACVMEEHAPFKMGKVAVCTNMEFNGDFSENLAKGEFRF